MIKITVKDWQNHGDYMLYANIVDKKNLSVLLQSTPSSIIVFGKDSDVETFGKELTKKKINFDLTTK